MKRVNDLRELKKGKVNGSIITFQLKPEVKYEVVKVHSIILCDGEGFKGIALEDGWMYKKGDKVDFACCTDFDDIYIVD